MRWFATYRDYLRRKIIREGAMRSANLTWQLEALKFWTVAILISWLSSYLDRPYSTIGTFVALAILVVSTIVLLGILIEVNGRAGDKFYSIYTRKILSRDYRDDR